MTTSPDIAPTAPTDRESMVRQFLATRDLTVDLVRVVAVCLVVVIHSLLVGISVDATGAFNISRPAQAEPWFKYATWIAQIMPLFFIVGGFASWQSWQSTLRKNGTGRDFFRARVLRLVYPALVWYAVMGIILWGAVLLGVPAAITGALVSGLGMPLWFLAAYLICQAALPFLAAQHVKRPYVTLVWLFSATIVVDIIRYTTGITQVGLINLLFVWPLMQQVGFFYATGDLKKIRKALLPIIAIVALTVVALAGYVAPYSLDMLDNLNPPTVPLIFIGIFQLAILLLIKPYLDRLMQRKAAQAIVFFLGTRAMTIYLWHLIIVILVSAAIIVFPALPQAGTSAWWATRPLTIALTFGILMLISLAVARFEKGPRPALIKGTPGRVSSAIIFIAATVPPFWAMEFTMDMPQLIWGTALLALAVYLALGRVGATQLSKASRS